MTARYVISDTHFDHENIIEYTDRPFNSLTDMNDSLQSNWNTNVNESDVVIHGGDISFMNKAQQWINSKLQGSILCVRGNHDNFLSDEAPFPVVEHAVIREGKYLFWLSHHPGDVPEDWTQWIIHGHTHNDDPFIHYDKKMVNISVEVLNYTPQKLSLITDILSSLSNGDVLDNIKDSDVFLNQNDL